MQLPPVPRCPRLPWFEPGSESSSATMPPLATGLWAPLCSAWPRRLVVLSETPRRTGPALVRRGVLPDPRSQQRLGYNDLGRPSKKLSQRWRSSLRPLLGHNAVIFFLRGTASLAPFWTFGVGVSQAPMAAAAASRTLRRSVRSAVAVTRLTVLPCGPRSSELPDELLTLF